MSPIRPKVPEALTATQSPRWSRRQLLRATAGLAGLTALGSSVAACGSPGSGSALAADTPADPKGVTLRLMVNQPHTTAFTQLIGPLWTKETGGRIDVTAVPYDQLTSKQILDVQSGAGEFDLFDYFYFGLGSLVEANAVTDLTDWIAHQPDLDAGDFLPAIYDPYTLINGRRYGLPYDGDLHLLFYNKELFDQSGVTPPTTWDDYDTVTEKITARGGGRVYGAVVQGQQVPMILGCSFINRLAGYGGTLLDGAGKPALTSDAAVAAAQHLVNVAPHALPTPLQIGFDQANTAFLSGQAAMIDTWTDMALRAEDPTQSKIAGKWGVVSLPVGGNNKTHRSALNAGFGLGVSAASQHKPEAAAFAKWATATKQNLLQASTAGSGIDANRTSVLQSDTYARATPVAIKAIRDSMNTAPLVWPTGPSSPKLLQDLVDQLALAVQGKQDVRTALQRAQDSWLREL